MKCPSCGAEAKGKFCEYCGSEMPQEKPTVNITNHYYGGTTPQENTEIENNLGKCPKCGNSKITFKRERVGTATQSRSRKNYIGSGRQSQSVSQSAYRTVGVCQNCGYTWNPNATTKSSGKKTWLWVLGWLCIFPLPLTILLLRKKDMKPAIKYGIIAVAWVLFFIIGVTGNSEKSDTYETESKTTNSNAAVVNSIEGLSFSSDEDITLKIGEKKTSGYLRVTVKSEVDISSEDIIFVSDNPEVATINFTSDALKKYLYYEVVGVGAGETEVYAISKDGRIESEHIKVTVPKPIEIESITVSPNKTEMYLGEKISTEASFVPTNAEDKTLTWTSSNESIAVVNSDGLISAVGAGSAIITVSAANGVSTSFEISVDGSKRTMTVAVSYSRQDDYNIGDEWNYITELNGERTTRTCALAVGEVLTFYAKFWEQDDNPDIGESSTMHTVTEEDLTNGFVVTMDVYVTENGGKNSGKSAYFLVTYTFTS